MEKLINDLRQSIEDIDTVIWLLQGECGNDTVDKIITRYSNIPIDLADTFKKLKETYGNMTVPI